MNTFIGKAGLFTYAGSGPESEPKEMGFKEFEYKDGDWYYKDSYSGYFQSWGRETVLVNQSQLW